MPSDDSKTTRDQAAQAPSHKPFAKIACQPHRPALRIVDATIVVGEAGGKTT
jgi:hypothetical protein